MSIQNLLKVKLLKSKTILNPGPIDDLYMPFLPKDHKHSLSYQTDLSLEFLCLLRFIIGIELQGLWMYCALCTNPHFQF